MQAVFLKPLSIVLQNTLKNLMTRNFSLYVIVIGGYIVGLLFKMQDRFFLRYYK
jgi:hypothetical protein